MTEKETIFDSKLKQTGIFNFNEFYNFCYTFLKDELNLDVAESKYSEKITGDSKEIKIKWEGVRKVTDYFRYNITIEYMISMLKDVEVAKGGGKIKTNSGIIEMKVKGTLERDYKGKFERNAFLKFLRSIYEKWVISARIDQFEEQLFGDCDEFLAQAKAYLDLEGKR